MSQSVAVLSTHSSSSRRGGDELGSGARPAAELDVSGVPDAARDRRLGLPKIVFRSKGGRTVLSNEVTVCDRCHALIHAGLLEVTGRPGEELKWIPRPPGNGARVRDVEALLQRLGQMTDEASTDVDARRGAMVSAEQSSCPGTVC